MVGDGDRGQAGTSPGGQASHDGSRSRQETLEAAKARLTAAWDLLKRTVATALHAAKAVVAKIASALGTLREILKILKSGALAKLFAAAHDAQKLAQPIVDKVAPLVGQVPAKADELASEKGKEVGPPGSPSVQRLAMQRVATTPEKSVGDQAGELILEGHIRQPDPVVPAAPPGEGFWGGVWRHMKAAGNHFLENWKTTLINVVYSLLLFYPVLLQEGPKLWEECKGVALGGGGVDRLDHVLGVLRRLVNIVAGLVATTGIWALIIGAFSGPGEVFVAGAFYTVSAAVIGADVALALAEVSKAWYSASRPETPPQTREHYLSMGSGSIIATAITAVLIALGVIASRLAGKFRLRGRSKQLPPENKPLDTKPPETKPPETKPGETKPPEERPPAPPTPARPTIKERLAEFYSRLKSAPKAKDAGEALDQIRRTLDQVEDELSGVAKRSSRHHPTSSTDACTLPSTTLPYAIRTGAYRPGHEAIASSAAPTEASRSPMRRQATLSSRKP